MKKFAPKRWTKIFDFRLEYCFPGTADQYELGDLGAKYGLLDGVKSFTANYNETQVSLFGHYSVLGRSIALHRKVSFLHIFLGPSHKVFSC